MANIKEFFGFQPTKLEMKSYEGEVAGGAVAGYSNGSDIFKAFIPNFLYKPPFGMPRQDNPPMYKKLAKNPYVFSVIKTLCDEATSNEWDIEVKEEFQEEGKDYDDKIKEIKQFFNNPNGNEESFQHILRQLITDLLEVDSAVIVKVFNKMGKLKQIFSRDGSLFLKNTDIYGYIGNRADFVLPLPDGFDGVAMDVGGTPTESQQQIMKQYSLLYKEQAAYFQYGWTAGSMPVPFGKREIVYMMQMPRADTIYGTSPISVMTEIIMSLIYGADYNLDFYTNNNMPDGAIQLLGAQQEHVKQFRKNWENNFKFVDDLGKTRKNFFKVPIATTEVKFTPFQMSSKEMEIIAQQEWFTKILWMVFGVNAEEMGFTENSNKSTGETQVAAFKRKAIKPILDVIAYHINTQLITEFFDNAEPKDVPLKFVFDEYDIGEDMKELAVLEAELRMGIKTPKMVAIERGINIEELEESQAEDVDKEVEKEHAVNGAPEDYEPLKPDEDKRKKPEEKGGIGSGVKGHTTARKQFAKELSKDLDDMNIYYDSGRVNPDKMRAEKKRLLDKYNLTTEHNNEITKNLIMYVDLDMSKGCYNNLKNNLKNDTKLMTFHKLFSNKVLKKQYNNDTIKLYRGTSKTDNGEYGDELISWTTSKQVAEEFSKHKNGKVIERDIKITEIAYHNLTDEGFDNSQYDEAEVLVYEK